MECEQPDFNFGDPERSSGSEMDVVNSSVVDDFVFLNTQYCVTGRNRPNRIRFIKIVVISRLYSGPMPLSNIVCNKMM